MLINLPYLKTFTAKNLFFSQIKFDLKQKHCQQTRNSKYRYFFLSSHCYDWASFSGLQTNCKGILFKLSGSSKEALVLHNFHTMTPFDAPGNKPFENTMGKGEIARNEQFLFFPQCFSTRLNITFCHFHLI